MIVKVLASGSDGNCVYVGTDTVGILIDIGLPKSKVEKILLAADIVPTRIDAVFITHEHKDHCRGLSFADKYKIPVYASEGTLKQLDRLDTGNAVGVDGWRGFDGFSRDFITVAPFRVSHDALEPYGYTIRGFDWKVSVLMDTGVVTDEMLDKMADSNIYVFECNHDIQILQDGPYDAFLKSRILSDNGHLSNDAAADALSKLVKGRGEQIFLTHMSSSNNLPALAEATVKRALRQRQVIAGKHYTIEVV